jgi:hypothetical protein
VLGPGLEREILWRLVTGEQGALVRHIGLADSSLTHIARTIRWSGSTTTMCCASRTSPTSRV